MNRPLNDIGSIAVEMVQEFRRRAMARDLVIGIVGLGYVGLPLAESFAAAGFRVVGFDVDEAKVAAVNEGRQLIKHIGPDRMSAMRDSGRVAASADSEALRDADALLICVPTPLSVHRTPDLSYVVRTTEALAEILRPGQLVVLESTTYPGTCNEVMRPILEERSGLRAGKDFALAYSPEREDPGNADYATSTIPKVIGADTSSELHMAEAVYGAITTTVPVSDLKTAEAVKLTENIFRLVNIALVNELKITYAALGIDIWEVIDAAKTKPFGFMPFYPGPGLGGYCIPIDPFYLTWKAREYGQSTRFIELAGELVSSLPRRVIEITAEALSSHLQRSLAGARKIGRAHV